MCSEEFCHGACALFDYSHQVSLVSILHALSIIVPYPPSVYLLQKIAACVPSFSLTYFQCHMLYFSWNSAFLTHKTLLFSSLFEPFPNNRSSCHWTQSQTLSVYCILKKNYDVLISSGKKSKRGKCSEKREEEKSEKEQTNQNQVFLAQESFVWDVNLVPVQKMRPKSK